MNWSIEVSPFFKSKIKNYQKKHPKETQTILDNLDTYHKALISGTNPMQINPSWIHIEPKGIKAIAQRGKRGAKESRLYIYPEMKNRILYLITIGGKERQSKDIEDAKRFVKQLEDLMEGKSNG
jgi:hypothetical protein